MTSFASQRCLLTERMIKIKNLNITRKALLLSVVFLLVFGFISCKKKESQIGLDVQGGQNLGINTVDTFEIRTYVEVVDSVTSNLKSVDLLGSYQDPKFGHVQYGFVTQILLSSNNPNFGNTDMLSIDSVVFAMKYSTLNSVAKYGESDEQTFEVYEIAEDLYYDSTYYTNSIVSTLGSDLIEPGSNIITPRPYDDAVVGEDTLEPQLRIRLDTTFGRRLINASLTGDLLDNEAFKNYFKGFQVRVNNVNQNDNEGGILYLDLTDVESKMTIYYREDTIPRTFDFTIETGENARFNQANFDMTGTFVEQVINDTASGMFEYYYQANNLWSAMEFPDIMKIKDHQGLIVNKAELFVPVSHYPTDELFHPTDMFVLYKDSLGEDNIVPDFFSSPGGEHDSDEGAYRFILTRYIQRILSGEFQNNGIRISNTNFFSTATRAVFNGPLSTNKKKPKLIITYSNY